MTDNGDTANPRMANNNNDALSLASDGDAVQVCPLCVFFLLFPYPDVARPRTQCTRVATPDARRLMCVPLQATGPSLSVAQRHRAQREHDDMPDHCQMTMRVPWSQQITVRPYKSRPSLPVWTTMRRAKTCPCQYLSNYQQ